VRKLTRFLIVLTAIAGISSSVQIVHPVSAMTNGLGQASGPSWSALIQFNDGPRETPTCTGTVVGNGWVLTAAHCVYSDGKLDEPKTVRVVLGRGNKTSPGKSYGVKRIVPAPGKLRLNSNDAALIQLYGFDANNTAAIPLAFEPSVVYASGGVTLYSYGNTFWDKKGKPKGKGNLYKSPNGAFVQLPECHGRTLCFHRTSSTTIMKGDSGSGWLRWTSGAWQLVGIESTVTDLGLHKKSDPAKGTSSLAVLQWIRKTARLPVKPANTVVRNPVTRKSWLIGSDGYRHWIPTGGDYRCFIAQGSQVVNLPRVSVDTIPERMGSRAKCTSPPPPVGTVAAWGSNSVGQLGNGATTDSSTPVQVSDLSGATTIASGWTHSLALGSDGVAWAWGHNEYGELGNSTATYSSTPVQVSGLSGVTAIAAGLSYGLALRSDGSVWAWGLNGYGQLGNGTATNTSTPVQVTGLSGVTAIAAGLSHGLALRSDGTVWAWGRNPYGQLGNGTTADSSTPVQVTGLSGVTAIASGHLHSLALRTDGTVWAWGDGFYGGLGNGTVLTRASTPVQVSGLSEVTAIAGGFSYGLAVRTDGTVWGWGLNNYGQLGNGTTTNTSTPVQVSGLCGSTAIAAGAFHSVALCSDGSVWAWGLNGYGQLGNSTTTNASTPVQVSGLSGATAITAGYWFSLALRT
jgi:hypothetical protein